MSGSTEGLRRKLAGAGDLQSVVRSMKALAASSIGQYERAVEALADYYRTIELGLAACLRDAPHSAAFVKESSPKKPATIGAVLFGSDQGLVGRFNEMLVEFSIERLHKLPGKTQKIWTVGERLHSLMADTDMPPARLLALPGSVDSIASLVGQILIEIEIAHARGEAVEIHLFYNHPKSAAVYEPVGKRLLPLDQRWQSKLTEHAWPTKCPPQILEGAAPALEAFLRGYLFVLLFRACAESLASENASRLAAMQRAEKNIDEILQELNRRFHRIRQEEIDEELFDVISGYEALSAPATGKTPLRSPRPVESSNTQ